MSKEVKCAECGFLAIRNQHTRELHEVEASMRKEWATPKTIIGSLKNVHIYEGLPLCFRRSPDFPDESIGNTTASEQIIEVINGDHPCDHYTPWQQGFTPKEHQEMLNEQRMLEWQRRVEIEDREWRTNQEKLTNKRHWQAIVWGALLAVMVFVVANALSAWVQSKIG